MATVDIVLTDLTFPEKLEDKYCKFRPLVSIRYRDSDNKITYAREALPGLEKGDYWECEKDNKKKANWVRDEAGHRVDMNKLDVSGREIIFNDLDIKKLERVEVEIFDVDADAGTWDKVKKTLPNLLPLAVSVLIPATLPLSLTLIKKAVEQGTGKKVSDLEKGLIDKVMGKEDGVARSLWLHSSTLKSDPQQTVTINGAGLKGDYSVTLDIEVS